MRYQAKKAGFWLVWILLCPIVFIRYVFSDITNRRFRYPTAWVKTSLAFRLLYDEIIKRKRINRPF